MESMIRYILLTLKYCSIVTNIVPSELQSLPIPLGRSVRPPYVNDPNPKVYEERPCGALEDCLLLPPLSIIVGVLIYFMIFFYGSLSCIIIAGYLVALLFHLVSCGYLFRFVEFHYCSCCMKNEYTVDLGGADGTGYPNGMTGLGGLFCLLCICGDGVVLRDGEVRDYGGGGGDNSGGGGS